jgi:hypothetical protein
MAMSYKRFTRSETKQKERGARRKRKSMFTAGSARIQEGKGTDKREE